METCKRCGEEFTWEGVKYPGVYCPKCDDEYWTSRYGTIGPLASPFTYSGVKTVDDMWKAMTEQRLGHALPAREECK